MSRQPRATICILTYGDYLPYFRRCFESVFKHTPRCDYELRVGFIDAPASFKYAMGWLMPSYVAPAGPRTGVQEFTLRDRDNHTVRLWYSGASLDKEPMARHMFYRQPLTTEYLIWFDDDTYVQAGWWDTLLPVFDEGYEYIGQEEWVGYLPGQTETIAQQPWYRQVPFQTRDGRCGVRFMIGGFVALRTARLLDVNHPVTSFRWNGETLKHHGADTLLGEIAHQHGWKRCRHDKHVKINVDLQDKHPAPRRGIGGEKQSSKMAIPQNRPERVILGEEVLSKIGQLLQNSGHEPHQCAESILWQTLGWRTRLIAQLILQQCGAVVQSGPFAGMSYATQSVSGALAPRLLGCYEAELHPFLDHIVQQPPDRIINIGCGEGYYAVGLARLLPRAQVAAFDSNPRAQQLCQQLAVANGVSRRVTVAGTFSFEDLNDLDRSCRTLILCDCEGGELTFLDPELAPCLLACNILVEMHEFINANTWPLLLARFQRSHEVVFISHGGRDPYAFPVLARLSQFDQFLACWEFRPGPTPWAYMTPRSR